MKIHFAVLLFTATVSVHGAQFINLDFESANTNGSRIEYRPNVIVPPGGLFPFGTGPADHLLPGWTVLVGGRPTNLVSIGNFFFETPPQGAPVPAHAGLVVPGSYTGGWMVSQPDGQYGLLMDNRAFMAERTVRVVQTGDIPADAQWLTFRRLSAALPALTLNGDFIVLSGLTNVLSDDPSRVIFDISPWAGQTIELGFAPRFEDVYALDSIAFLVPEPSTYALLGLGIITMLVWRTSNKRQHL